MFAYLRKECLVFACLIAAMLFSVVDRASASVIPHKPFKPFLEYTSPVMCDGTFDDHGKPVCQYRYDKSIITNINVDMIGVRDPENVSPNVAPIINGEAKVGMKMSEYIALVDSYVAKMNKDCKTRGEL